MALSVAAAALMTQFGWMHLAFAVRGVDVGMRAKPMRLKDPTWFDKVH